MTEGFKEKLGAGGAFGAVYKGVLTNRRVVAVKQPEGMKQFRMEVAMNSSTVLKPLPNRRVFKLRRELERESPKRTIWLSYRRVFKL